MISLKLLISDHRLWQLACDYEFDGGGDLFPSTQHPKWDRQGSLLPTSLRQPSETPVWVSLRLWPVPPLLWLNRTLKAAAAFGASLPHRFPICTTYLEFCTWLTFMSTQWYILKDILFNITLHCFLYFIYSAFGFVNQELLRVSRLPYSLKWSLN